MFICIKTLSLAGRTATICVRYPGQNSWFPRKQHLEIYGFDVHRYLGYFLVLYFSFVNSIQQYQQWGQNLHVMYGEGNKCVFQIQFYLALDCPVLLLADRRILNFLINDKFFSLFPANSVSWIIIQIIQSLNPPKELLLFSQVFSLPLLSKVPSR